MKTQYHPSLLLAYYIGNLPNDIKATIPRTTIADWKKRILIDSYGKEWYNDNRVLFESLNLIVTNYRLRKLCLSYLRVIAIKNYIKNNFDQLKSKLGNHPLMILRQIKKARKYLKLTVILKILDLKYQEYYQLIYSKACLISPFKKCLTRNPNQLLSDEVMAIKHYASLPEYLHWSLASLYQKIKKDQIAYFSIATFYKYAKQLQIKRSKINHRRKNHSIGIRASQPLEIIQVDTTIFRLINGTKVYIYLAIDNYSRAILSYKVALDMSSRYVVENLKDIYSKYLESNDLSARLISDDGSENYGQVKTYLQSISKSKLTHLIAQKDIISSNSMIEHTNKRLKYDYLYRAHCETIEDVRIELKKNYIDHNNRPHHVLNGLSPHEVLIENKRPELVNYDLEMQTARQTRKANNQAIICNC